MIRPWKRSRRFPPEATLDWKNGGHKNCWLTSALRQSRHAEERFQRRPSQDGSAIDCGPCKPSGCVRDADSEWMQNSSRSILADPVTWHTPAERHAVCLTWASVQQCELNPFSERHSANGRCNFYRFIRSTRNVRSWLASNQGRKSWIRAFVLPPT